MSGRHGIIRASRVTAQRVDLWNRQGGLCWWCGKPAVLILTRGGERLPHNAATIDHLDSRLSPERGKHPGERRRVMACMRCNNTRARGEARRAQLAAAESPWELWSAAGRYPQPVSRLIEMVRGLTLLRELRERLERAA